MVLPCGGDTCRISLWFIDALAELDLVHVVFHCRSFGSEQSQETANEIGIGEF